MGEDVKAEDTFPAGTPEEDVERVCQNKLRAGAKSCTKEKRPDGSWVVISIWPAL